MINVMDNEKINKIEETNPETNTCSGTCDDNCKIKNKAFFNYQYRPTQIAIDPVTEIGEIYCCNN